MVSNGPPYFWSGQDGPIPGGIAIAPRRLDSDGAPESDPDAPAGFSQ